MWKRFFVLAFLVCALVGVFGQVHDFDFVSWDDNELVYENPNLNPVSNNSLLQVWLRPYDKLYVPLTYSAYEALAVISKRSIHSDRDGTTSSTINTARSELTPDFDPRPFHIANLFFHIINTLLVYAILRLIVPSNFPAIAGALIFGLHPVQVETVTWVSELKGVLCGSFSLLALWLFSKYISHSQEANRPRWSILFVLSTLCFVLALLSKPSAVVVPLIAWTLGQWVFNCPWRKLASILAPWFGIAFLWICLTRWLQPIELNDLRTVEAGVMSALWTRPLIAGDALTFYLSKLVFPFNLGPDYGRTPASVLSDQTVFLTALVPVGIGIILWSQRWRHSRLIAPVVIFLCGVVANLGLIPFLFQTYSTVADRYLYLSMLGPSLGLAYLINLCKSPLQNRIISAGAITLVLVLGVLSAGQTQHWRNTYALSTHAKAINPKSWIFCYNLGYYLQQKGRLEEAATNYRAAIAIRPNYFQAHNNLSLVLLDLNQVNEAIVHCNKLVQLDASYAPVHIRLGIARARQGQLSVAIKHYEKAAYLDPNNALLHFNWGVALARQGQNKAAISHLTTAQSLNPESQKIRQILAFLQNGSKNK